MQLVRLKAFFFCLEYPVLIKMKEKTKKKSKIGPKTEILYPPVVKSQTRYKKNKNNLKYDRNASLSVWSQRRAC